MINTKELKKYAKTCGADVLRIGSMSGWEGAPKQNDARYIFPDAKCIIGLAFRIPRGYLRGIEEGTFFSVYEFMGYSGMNLTYMPVALREIVCYIEDHGYEAVPIPNWDNLSATHHTDYLPKDYSKLYGRKSNFHSRPVSPDKPRPDVFISYRAAAVISNLGEIGWSKMVLTPEFGPRQRVVFILTDAPLDLDDPILPGTLCDRCKFCAKNCTGQAIPIKDSVKKQIAGIEIEHCNLNLARCSNAYSGGNRKFNPFWRPDVKLKEKDFMNEYLSKKYFNRKKGPCPHLINRCRNNPAIEGARGCIRACMVHLEEQGKLKNKFVHPFRRHKEWILD